MNSTDDPKRAEGPDVAARSKAAFEQFKTTHTYQNMAQVCPAISLETAFFFGFMAGNGSKPDANALIAFRDDVAKR